MEDGEEGFAVGAVVEGDAAVGTGRADFIDTGRYVVERSGPELEALPGSLAEGETQSAGEWVNRVDGVGGLISEVAIPP